MDYNSPDELLAVVNALDEEIGAEARGRIHREGLLHRAVHVLVFDAGGRLIIQQRSEKKDTFPLHWECVGGHLGPGEDYGAAATREVEEELGVKVHSLERLCKVDACDMTGNEFITIYRGRTSEEPRPEPQEIIALDRLTMQALRDEIARNARRFSPTFINTLMAVDLIPRDQLPA